MALYSEITADIDAAERGSQVGAFFDFDGTIIYGFSATVFIREQLRAGFINLEEFAKLTRWLTSFGLGSMDFASMLALSSQFLADMPEDKIEDFSKSVYEKYIAKSIYPESRALIEAHLAKGHTVAIISSATQYQIKYAAEDLNIEHCFSSMLEISDKKLTGKINQSCFGVGKVRAAQKLIKEKTLDPKQCFFYSDGDEDLPLLELVGNPRPLNPNKKLKSIAKKNDWQIREFNSRGLPSLQKVARTVGAYSSFLSSIAAGLPILALTRSARKARNFSTSLFADSASALIGLDLKVKNEHNLWSQRPAVFIFNHQSKTDLLIIASLLRRDIVGVGKQEIKNIPLIGSALENMGMVMIDRKNATSSIEAMRPLVEAINDQQVSVCIAPEGTRSVSKKLAPFKKGAFHIAMQAKVPIIPIVIHNALDSAPKGQFLFTPSTVEVEVLEPVDTANWQTNELTDNIDKIWSSFQCSLDRNSAPTKKPTRKKTATSKATPKKQKSVISKNEPTKTKETAARVKKSTIKREKPANGRTANTSSEQAIGSSKNKSLTSKAERDQSKPKTKKLRSTRKKVITTEQMPDIQSLLVTENPIK